MFGDIDSEHKMATDSNDQQLCRLIRKNKKADSTKRDEINMLDWFYNYIEANSKATRILRYTSFVFIFI